MQPKYKADFLMEEPTIQRTQYFSHIYLKSGFSVSREMMEDGESFEPKRNHVCLRMGYWCWKNALENPKDIITFSLNKLKNNKKPIK